MKDLQVISGLAAPSPRLHAQQELITRPRKDAVNALWKIAEDKTLPLQTRVAGIFGFAQVATENDITNFSSLISDDLVREFVLRALADRKDRLKNIPLAPFIDGLTDPSERVQVAAAVGLGRLGRVETAEALLRVKIDGPFEAPLKGTEGPHATPNSQVVPAHVAVRSLVNLHAVDACLNAVDGENSDLALWALRYMHDSKAVDGLIDAYQSANDKRLKTQILTTLSRLYQKEAPYDGTWWWSTRPDTHGPYYKTIKWEASDKIKAFLSEVRADGNADEKQFFADLNGKLRMGISGFGGEETVEIAEIKEPEVNFEKIKNKEGQIGKSPIEDIILAVNEIKGDALLGEKLFTRQGCQACHQLKASKTMKGPFMGQIGSIMSRDQIAESILKPNASISQGFASVNITTKENKIYGGFVSEESADKVVIRNIAGQVFTIKTEDILEREELDTSMMPAGMVNSLSYHEFASLLTFLAEQK